jgi:hypothetical protein
MTGQQPHKPQQDQIDTYRRIIMLRDDAEARGDVVMARQYHEEAAQYAETRMGRHERNIVGA